MNNWTGIILFLIFVGVPVLKQVAEYLQRKKEAREIGKVRELREFDALRTGSVASSTSSPPPRPTSQYTQSGQVNAADRLREIQAKRREALERARRHANAGVDIAIGVATTGQPPAARPTPRARSISGARPVQGARPRPPAPGTRGSPRQPAPGSLIGGRAPLPSRQVARTPTPQQRSRPTPRSVLPTAPPFEPLLTTAVKRKRAKHAEMGAHSTVHRLVADAEQGAVIRELHAAVSAKQLAQMSPIAWRRALVLQEVLSKPIALRQ